MLFASPWSPPAWMKDTGSLRGGGRLLPEYYAVWAAYMAKYLAAYRQKGIRICAVTVQNEPHAAQTWESCRYTAEEEAEMAVRYLKPAFAAQGLEDVKIIVWDHNKERVLSRAVQTFAAAGARDAVWGVGFHWYSGSHFSQLSMTGGGLSGKKADCHRILSGRRPRAEYLSGNGVSLRPGDIRKSESRGLRLCGLEYPAG